MKLNFKTTALAVLVTLGATACGSSSSGPVGNLNSQTTPNTQPVQPDQPQPVQPDQPQPVQPDQPSPEELKIQAELAKMPKLKDGDETNALISISGYYQTEYSNASSSKRGSSHISDRVYLPKPYDNTNLNYKSPFSSTSSTVNIDLTEETKKAIQNGGEYLGVHQGSWSNPSVDSFSVTVEDPTAGRPNDSYLVGSTVDTESKDINYFYINNPYSTYGVLFTNQHDQKMFYTGIATSEYGDMYKNVNNTSELDYVDSLKGDVTYKGDVIAVVERGVEGTRKSVLEAPKVDGSITLNAHFGKRSEENSIKGELNSNTVGQVELVEQRIGTSVDFRGNLRKLDDNQNNLVLSGSSYSGSFVGKEANDVVGGISLQLKDTQYNSQNYGSVYKADSVASYQAVFGATKQAK